MTVLLAFLALAAPPPNAPIPRDPAALASRLEATTHDLADAIDRWQPRTGRVPEDVTLYALYQQRILILLSEKPALAKTVFERLRGSPLRSEVLARRGLGRLSRPRPLSAFRTEDMSPEHGLRWLWLACRAAVDLWDDEAWDVLATRHVRLARDTGALTVLPMALWRRYGLGGNVHDPHDAILGAANYLHANGAPGNYRRALYRYNPSWLYVDAVLRYASRIRSDPRAYYVFYSRQVFVRTPHGLVRLTGPR